MLAQNFKSAADLKISEEQKDALIKTLVLLETGKLHHFAVTPEIEENEFAIDRGYMFSGDFNMAYFHLKHSCGTAACIAGTAELISGIKFVGRDRTAALDGLFYGGDLELSSITPAQAATALRSYLTTGDPRWDLAVS
ncbi:hypothetical protein ABIE93_005982 [Bradyrhizobium elkanii]|uniref:hypothetical protein n=1 Tax=Bradyrhizobium elkanii TaxID=29448 RepID=UPI00351517FB